MEAPSIWGQWMGNFAGEAPGFALLNIEAGKSQNPFVCIVQNIGGPLATRVLFKATYKGDSFEAESDSIKTYDPRTNQLVDGAEFLKRTKGCATKIIIKGHYTTHTFKGEWSSDNLGGGTFDLSNPATRLVDQPDYNFSWSEYRAYVDKLLQSKVDLLYRGQASNQWRLRTSFHREKRYDLGRYWDEVCPVLQKRFLKTGVSYDLNKPEDIGSLLCFAQHHGFPTPLLDWTRNPYVAAFFAFERGPTVTSPNNCCRIYIFDHAEWSKDTNNGASLADPTPLISLRSFNSKDIPRQDLQECMHSFSNVEDLEAWIRLTESDKKKRYLTTIDIPWNQRASAKADLAKMGCTAETLFGDRDSMCRTLREELF